MKIDLRWVIHSHLQQGVENRLPPQISVVIWQSCCQFLSQAFTAVFSIFQFNQGKWVVRKTLKTSQHLWVRLYTTWPGRDIPKIWRHSLAHRTLLHSVILNSFHPSFTWKEMGCLSKFIKGWIYIFTRWARLIFGCRVNPLSFCEISVSNVDNYENYFILWSDAAWSDTNLVMCRTKVLFPSSSTLKTEVVYTFHTLWISTRPCQRPEGQSLPDHDGGPVSIPGQST
jgi:hypothetical protein